MVDVKTIAWTAGFLEGEGWFGSSQKGKGYPTIVAAQVQREPLERLKAYYGGFITSGRRPQKPTHNQTYVWALSGVAGTGLMMSLYPLMSPKRQQRIKATLGAWRKAKIFTGARAACPQGHPYSGRNSNGSRVCRTCSTANNRRFSERQKNRILTEP